MSQGEVKFWHVTDLRSGNNLPKGYIKGLTKDDKALIKNKLEAIERIELTIDWPNFKHFSHNGISLNQLAAGNHRIYLHLFNDRNNRYAVVCYICRKKGQTAKTKDLNRAANNTEYAVDLYTRKD